MIGRITPQLSWCIKGKTPKNSRGGRLTRQQLSLEDAQHGHNNMKHNDNDMKKDNIDRQKVQHSHRQHQHHHMNEDNSTVATSHCY